MSARANLKFQYASSSGEAAGRRTRRPGAVLLCGFGGLLICILGAAAGTALAFNRLAGEEAQTRRIFLERLAALDQIRARIYLSGTYVRDLLLAPDVGAAAAQTARLAGLEREARAALENYGQSLAAEEREPFEVLRSQIDAYWRVLEGAAAWSPEERDRQRSQFFYNELVPRRTAMLQIADRIAAVHERGLGRAEEQIAVSAGRLRRSLMLIFAIALLGGLVLAILTARSMLRLERELERRLHENAQARADLEDLSGRLLRAQESERRSLARELHDEVGQSLSAILMETESAECSQDTGEIREHLAAIRRLAEKTVNEVRDLALLLRPSMLDDLGLVPALNWHARETARRTGLRVVVSAGEGAGDVPEEHKTCIYRMVQEAVNNAAKHSGARTIQVALERGAGSVVARIQDDGAGFETRMARGLGLLGMEERIRRLGGRLQIDSQPGRGTLVAAELPLAELPQEHGYEAHPHPVG